MTAAMEALYGYAEDYMLCGLLAQEPEYGEALRCAEKLETQFREPLDSESRERLEALMDERNHLSFYRERAWFRAGFRLAAELMRE